MKGGGEGGAIGGFGREGGLGKGEGAAGGSGLEHVMLQAVRSVGQSTVDCVNAL